MVNLTQDQYDVKKNKEKTRCNFKEHTFFHCQEMQSLHIEKIQIQAKVDIPRSQNG